MWSIGTLVSGLISLFPSLKIISLQEDRNWFKAELNERIGFVPKNYVKLKANYWYVGNMPRLQAESFLLNNHRDKPNGSFLVRDSESVPNTCNFSLSVKYNNKVQHYKIVNSKNKYILWQYLFNSLNELVSFYKHNSIAKNYPLTLVECIFPKNLRKLRSVRSFIPTNAGEIGFEADEEILLIDGSQGWCRGPSPRGWDVGRVQKIPPSSKNRGHVGFYRIPTTHLEKMMDQNLIIYHFSS